jgi:hypothetical protein
MARRGKPRGDGRRHSRDDRPSGMGSHWRADGAPKRAYSSESEAWVAADGQRYSTGVVLRVYRCDVCPAWHMAKADGRDRR